jgi:hypothetical protein
VSAVPRLLPLLSESAPAASRALSCDQRPSTVIESGELSTRSVCVVWNAHRRVYNHNEWQLGTVSFSTEFYGALLLAGPTLWHG